MDRIAEIRSRLEQALSPEHIEITDNSHQHQGHAGTASGAGHYSVTVISKKFSDQNTIQRHRMVYSAIGDMIPTEIHALSITALSEAGE